MPKIVNLGSACFDRVYQVPSIARPGETLRATSMALFPGGKGLNQSLAARRAGAEVVHVGCLGADGAPLRALLHEAGIGVDGFRLRDDIATAHAVIQVTATGDNAIVIVGGSNFAIEGADVDYALSQLGNDDWLLLQNEINDLDRVLRRAHAAGARICLNLAPYSDGAASLPLELAALLIVNETEAEGLTGHADVEAALPALRARCPRTSVVLTLGEQGLLYDAGDGVRRMSAHSVTTVDGTGAGDAFIGYLLAALLHNAPLERALQLGSAAGALAATVAGAASSIPSRAAVLALVGQGV